MCAAGYCEYIIWGSFIVDDCIPYYSKKFSKKQSMKYETE